MPDASKERAPSHKDMVAALRGNDSAIAEGGQQTGIVAVSKRIDSRSYKKFRRYLALDDFEIAAKRQLPHMIYGYVSGATETRSALTNAAEAFREYSLVPRHLVDISCRSMKCSLFGKEYTAPFGVSPLGGAAMIAHDGDRALASAARNYGIPMILSASSLTTLEDVHSEYPDVWFQAYLPGDNKRILAMLERVERAGYDTIVVTADTSLPGNRENNARTGFSMPLRVTPRIAIDSLLHPRWLFGTVLRTYLERGVLYFENMDAVRGPAMFSQNSVRNMDSRDKFSWRHIELMRKHWKGRLIIKGVLATDDAIKAREIGVDGIIVSNHGGRQLDYAVTPLTVLPEIKAVSGTMSVMLDGNVRRGSDIIKALALGADFVFVGRPFLYAAAVGGPEGVLHAMSILGDEVYRNIGLLGLTTLSEISPETIRKHGKELK